MGSTPAFFRVSRAVGTSDFLRAAPSDSSRGVLFQLRVSVKLLNANLIFAPSEKHFY